MRSCFSGGQENFTDSILCTANPLVHVSVAYKNRSVWFNFGFVSVDFKFWSVWFL